MGVTVNRGSTVLLFMNVLKGYLHFSFRPAIYMFPLCTLCTHTYIYKSKRGKNHKNKIKY